MIPKIGELWEQKLYDGYEVAYKTTRLVVVLKTYNNFWCKVLILETKYPEYDDEITFIRNLSCDVENDIIWKKYEFHT